MNKENLLTVLILAGLIGGVLFGQFAIYDPSATEEKAEKGQKEAKPSKGGRKAKEPAEADA